MSDPTDDERAAAEAAVLAEAERVIAPTRVVWVPKLADPTRPTWDEINAGVDLGVSAPAPPPNLQQLRDLIDHAIGNVHTLRYGRFEVGGLVWADLQKAATPRNLEHAGPLYGVPVVVRDDMELTAWRLLDPAGEVIEEGTL